MKIQELATSLIRFHNQFWPTNENISWFHCTSSFATPRQVDLHYEHDHPIWNFSMTNLSFASSLVGKVFKLNLKWNWMLNVWIEWMFCIIFVNNGFDACKKEDIDFLTSNVNPIIILQWLKSPVPFLIWATKSTTMKIIMYNLMRQYSSKLSMTPVLYKRQIFICNSMLIQNEFNFLGGKSD